MCNAIQSRIVKIVSMVQNAHNAGMAISSKTYNASLAATPAPPAHQPPFVIPARQSTTIMFYTTTVVWLAGSINPLKIARVVISHLALPAFLV